MLQPSQHLQAAYWAVGWILGQAMVNRATVGLQLAPLLFHRLLQPTNMGFQVSGQGVRTTDRMSGAPATGAGDWPES